MLNNTWEKYSNRFYREANKSGYSDYEIKSYLDYAFNLFEKKLPIIYDQVHLSLLVGYKIDFLLKITSSHEKFYRIYNIPKKTSGTRVIAEPLPSLKEIQRWILDNILNQVKISKFAKAYRRGYSIRSNAWFHKEKKLLLRIDVSDFFGSIRFEHVSNVYQQMGYNKSVVTMLTNLCVLKKKLPQGAPTSPALSNIFFIPIDKRISSFAIKRKINYTRYADDMTFSGDFEPGMLIKFVESVLKDYDLVINKKKTRVLKKHQRQLVTGIVVNEKLQAPRKMRKELRQAVYYIEKFGLSSHLEKTNNKKANHIKYLLGIANFILFINPDDREVREYVQLLSRYLEFDN